MSSVASAVETAIPFWIRGQKSIPNEARFGDVSNPATGQIIRRVPFADQAVVDAAVRSAAMAFPQWRSTTPLRRARILSRFREIMQSRQEKLAAVVSEEHGKVFLDAMGSVQRGIEVVEFATAAPHLLKGEHSETVGQDVDAHSRLQPLGVCAGITPFNFPAMVPLWMFPIALACGNTFVLKPSEKNPSASILMAEWLQEAGLPDGVFNVIHGDKIAVDALLNHPDIKAISFVGSTPVARYVYATAAKNGKRVQALGGAKNHAVVLPDADFDFAADAIAGAAYGSAGERCMAISVVVAVGDAGNEVVAKLADRAGRLKVGPGDMAGVDMGPLITGEHRHKVRGYVDRGVAEGANLIVDGRELKIEGHEQGFFLGPTLFDHVTPEMTIYKDEIFGPVLAVVRAETFEEAIRIVNQNQYGNGAALFTKSGGAARQFEDEIEIGMVGINVPIPVPMAFYSFGGWKASLFGDLHMYGVEGVQFYTRTKAITERWPKEVSRSSGMMMPTLS